MAVRRKPSAAEELAQLRMNNAAYVEHYVEAAEAALGVRAPEDARPAPGPISPPDEGVPERTSRASAGASVHVGQTDETTPPEASETSRPRISAQDTNQWGFAEEKIYRIPLDQIVVGEILVNARVMDEDNTEFRELVDSIQKHGQITPVVVGLAEDGAFHLIMGERRFRALQALGYPTIKAQVTDAPREDWEPLMLIENLMRTDLKAWEEARGYQMLLDRGWTQKRIAEQVGKSAGHISTVLAVAKNHKVAAGLDERRIPSVSFAREFGPLLDKDGNETIPGSISRAIEYLERKNPSVLHFRAWLRAELLSGRPDAEKRKKPVRTPVKATFIRTAEQQLAAVCQQARSASVIEREWLAKLFEVQAKRLREIPDTE